MLTLYLSLVKVVKIELLSAINVHQILLMIKVSRQIVPIWIVFYSLWDFSSSLVFNISVNEFAFLSVNAPLIMLKEAITNITTTVSVCTFKRIIFSLRTIQKKTLEGVTHEYFFTMARCF
jgi:hypothetical protein